jgi:hypothetical protein
MTATTYIGLIVIAIIIIILIKARKSLSKKAIKWIIIPSAGYALIILCSVYVHWSHSSALKAGDYILVEGTVENFSPAASNMKGYESFQVNGKRFLYSKGNITGGLTHSLSDSIKSGSEVKVYYKGKAILRVEVKK